MVVDTWRGAFVRCEAEKGGRAKKEALFQNGRRDVSSRTGRRRAEVACCPSPRLA